VASFTSIDICNLALTALGEERIVALTDNTAQAQACKAFYDHAVEEVLRVAKWASILSRAELAQLADAPLMGWGYQYQLPNNCLRVWELQDSGGNKGHPWIKEGKRLLTDMDEAFIVYASNAVDTSQYDSLLRSTIAYRLAYHLAYSLTQSREIQAQQWQQFVVLMHEARAANAAEGLPEADMDEVPESKSWTAR